MQSLGIVIVPQRLQISASENVFLKTIANLFVLIDRVIICAVKKFYLYPIKVNICYVVFFYFFLELIKFFVSVCK